MPQHNSKQITVAKVLKPFGIKGALKCLFFTQTTSLIKPGLEVELWRKTRRQKFKILEVIGGCNLLLEDFGDRNEAELWRGAEVLVERNDFPEISPEEFYLHDLIGSEIFDSEGILLGKLAGFTDNTVQPIAIIETLLDTEQTKKYSVPFVKPFIKNIDDKNKKIILDPPEGSEDLEY